MLGKVPTGHVHAYIELSQTRPLVQSILGGTQALESHIFWSGHLHAFA